MPCQVGQRSSLVVIGGGEAGLCSVSVDGLDHDCLSSSVDICVSSLMSACLTLLLPRIPPYANQRTEQASTL